MMLLDFLFPKRSLAGAEGAFITEEERRALSPVPRKTDAKELRARGIDALDELVTAGSYRTEPLLRTAIWMLKYRRVTALAEDMARLMFRAVPLLTHNEPAPVLCPVPLHWSRLFQRGFNQSALLASALASNTGWEERDLLVRTRPTGHQARRKKRADRLRAIRSSMFRCRKPGNLPSHVVLIDDLVTTGATLNACAKALRHAGCRRVSALVIAQG